MKFTVDKSALLPKLALASSIVTARPTIPILDSIKLSIKDNKLTLYITDLEVGMISTIDVVSDSDIEICLPIKLLKDSISKLSDQKLDFKISEGSCQVLYNSGKGSFRIPTYDASDYPSRKVGNEEYALTLSEGAVKGGFSRATRFVREDQLRPVLSGVLIDSTAEGVLFVATDAHRLIVHKVGEAIPDQFSKTIPIKACRVIERLLSYDDKISTFAFDSNSGTFSIDDTAIEFRLIDGQFPKYKSVIPNDNNNIVTLDRHLLINTVERASIFCAQHSKHISLGIDFMEINISTQDIDKGNEFAETIDAEGGSELSVGVRSDFLLDVLNTLTEEKIIIKAKEASRALLFTNESSEDTICLLMPIVKQ